MAPHRAGPPLTLLEKRADAEKNLNMYLKLPPEQRMYRYNSDALLMLGFLREEAGDSAAARALWKEARFQKNIAEHGDELGNGTTILNALIAGGLSEDLTEAEALALRDQALRIYTGEATANLIRNNIPLPPAVFIDCWKSPRGRKAARDIVFQALPFRDHIRLPAILCGVELVRRDAFGGKLTPEHEALCGKLAGELVEAFTSGTLNETQVLLLGSTWKGVTGVFGWANVKKGLKPEFRGPMAYVLGHRFLLLKYPADAKKFFEQARDDAPKDSELHRLAENELKRLANP
jgi:hypothetical protein